VRTQSTIETSFAPAVTDQTIRWINKTNINFQPNGETLARIYNTQTTLKDNGMRDCAVYDYTGDGINISYYIDNILVWPLRIIYVTVFENQSYTLDFNLRDTNINGL
jgi:hypothetical protein